MYDPPHAQQQSSTQHHHPHHLQKRKSTLQSTIQMPSSPPPPSPRNNNRNPPPTTLFKKWGTRHTLTFLGFLGFASSYSMRVNLSIAIVSMVNNHTHHNHNHSANESSVACPELVGLPPPAESLHNGSSFPKFDWSSSDQGIILGSFFYGYVATQIPGGLLANRIGGKWVFGLGMLTTALFSLITPLAATYGLPYLILVRVIQGLGEGVTNPSMHSLLAQWVPPLERSMLGAFIYAGAQMGTVIALPISGWLLGNDQGYWLTSGWPSVFYVFGILGIVWFVFWSMLVYDSPAVHPRISLEELQYIQESSSGVAYKFGGDDDKKVGRGVTPWRSLLTSGPVLAILVAQTGHGWGLYTMLTELPTYMDDVLHFDIKQNAYLSALPYFLMWAVSVISSYYADRMRASGWSTSVVRKIFNTMAHWLPSILLVLAANTACDRTLTVTLITLAISFTGASCASFQVNHIDLSPNHAAVMMGITNGFANLCGIGAPYVAGVIINEGSSIARWRIIFYIAAAVYFIDNIIYLLFASGKTQPWDSPSSDDNNDRIFTRSAAGGSGGGSGVRTPRSRYAINNEEEEDLEGGNDSSPLLVP